MLVWLVSQEFGSFRGYVLNDLDSILHSYLAGYALVYIYLYVYSTLIPTTVSDDLTDLENASLKQ